MDDLKPYAVFAETVAAGSMSAAARRLGLTPSAVSQTLRALEQQTGVVLLHRSTRKLTLTEAGARCYPHCLKLLESARAAADALTQARDAPVGELRIAAPVGFGAHIAPALAPVLTQWPGLRLRLLVDDALIDLIDARVDIALRVGQLADSAWVAHPLGHIDVLLCASPAYLERHGIPEHPEDLARHHALTLERELAGQNTLDREARNVSFSLEDRDGKTHPRIDMPVRASSNNQLSLQQLCEQGLGIARLGHIDIGPQLARGALIRVLPGWQCPAMPISALTPQREGEQPAKVRVAMAALKRQFADLGNPLGGKTQR